MKFFLTIIFLFPFLLFSIQFLFYIWQVWTSQSLQTVVVERLCWIILFFMKYVKNLLCAYEYLGWCMFMNEWTIQHIALKVQYYTLGKKEILYRKFNRNKAIFDQFFSSKKSNSRWAILVKFEIILSKKLIAN